jgi:phage gpG-like protein|tara:strand:+ start:14852 stop:15244 length:393 start_codon:yes stop_codon:yes gene_type:complete
MIKWDGDKLILDIDNAMASRLPKAGAVVVGETKRLLGRQGRPSLASQAKGAEVTHSKPGEPPKWQTKTLRQSITQESVSKHEQRVGTNVVYARALELGYDKRNLLARPYLRPGLRKSQKKITSILTAPMK